MLSVTARRVSAVSVWLEPLRNVAPRSLVVTHNTRKSHGKVVDCKLGEVKQTVGRGQGGFEKAMERHH